MNLKIIRFFLSISFIFLLLNCGGGGGSGGTDETGTGSDVNDSWDVADISCTGSVTGGTFSDSGGNGASVYVADGELSPCSNVSETPTLTVASSLPSGLDVNTSEGDANVTKSGAAYSFNIMGDRGFTTDTDGAVTITLPFDESLVPVADRTAPKVFILILSQEDNTLIPIVGEISAGSVTTETMGLPKQFTAAVIYNPNMTSVGSAVPASPAISNGSTKAPTSEPPWPGQAWCASYNAGSAALIAAIKSREGLSVDPTPAQVRTAIKTYVADGAANAQQTYEAAGFRAANLHPSATVTGMCQGDISGAIKRYFIYIYPRGSQFEPGDLLHVQDLVLPWGTIIINEGDLAFTSTYVLGSTAAIVAHEMLHAIQNGYETYYTSTMQGYWEGTATAYEMTINNNGTIAVLSAVAGQTWLLSDFLTAEQTGGDTVTAYANQDFFAYVGRKYNSGSLSYIAGLFEKFRTKLDELAAGMNAASAKALKFQPERSVLFGAMSSYFESEFGYSLQDIYLDFLRQRAFDHNSESKFGRTGEIASGFASNLFKTSTTDSQNSIKTVSIEVLNATDCNVTNGIGRFSNIAPYASRVVQIQTSKAASGSTTKVTLTITPSTGAVGDTVSGYSYRSGVSSALASADTEFTSFGQSISDTAVVAVANITNDSTLSFDFSVACEGGGSGGEGGSSTFSLTEFSLPGQSISPAYIQAPSFLGANYSTVYVAESAFDTSAWARKDYLLFELSASKIVGVGTYTTSGCYVESSNDMSIIYSPDSSTVGSGGYTFCASSGTVTFTAYGTNTGDHVTGSLSTTMQSVGATPQLTGTLKATFDLVVGSSNAL